MNFKVLSPILFICFSSGLITAQQNGISAFLGPAFHLSEKASGYQLAIAYQRKASKNSAIAMEMSQLFHSSRGILPKDIANMSLIFRDFTHVEPLGPDANPFLWNEQSFPSIRLRSKPDRFFHFNVGLKYLYRLRYQAKGKWTAGLGAFLSYSDEMKLIKLLKTEKLVLTVPPTAINEAYVPIFYYNSYLDFSLAPEITYHYQLGQQFLLGFRSQLHIFPTSNKTILAVAASCKKFF